MNKVIGILIYTMVLFGGVFLPFEQSIDNTNHLEKSLSEAEQSVESRTFAEDLLCKKIQRIQPLFLSEAKDEQVLKFSLVSGSGESFINFSNCLTLDTQFFVPSVYLKSDLARGPPAIS